MTVGIAPAIALAVAFAGIVASTANAQTPDVGTAARLLSIASEGITVTAEEGTPAAMAVRQDGVIVGYLASTTTVVGSVGYSGKPIDILVAVNAEARIAGAMLRLQSEPILTIGVTEADIAAYTNGFRDHDLRTIITLASSNGLPDAIAGATLSSTVIRDAIIRTGRLVALSRGLIGGASATTIDRATFEPRDWPMLVGEPAIASRRITVGEVRRVLGQSLYTKAGVADDAIFVDLHTALITPPTIGQNLLGQRDYGELIAGIGAEDHAVLIAADGLYSVKGTAWRRSGVFERIELVQGDRTIRLTRDGHRRIERIIAGGAPGFREIGVFVIPAASGFDATIPWRLSLLVTRETTAGAAASAKFDLTYNLPDRYLMKPVTVDVSALADAPPLWVQIWQSRTWEIAFLIILLSVLAAILVFQDVVVRHYRFYRGVRLGFLATTILVLGWGLGAQLSVVQVFAFAHALVSGFQWETFLLDPLVFILWSFVAVALLFWGRGVFCGWLCPFGALQELVNEAARALRIRQIVVPFAVHERLWPIKYIIFLGLFALSLGSITQAFWFAEIEPFKTVITLGFAREWPFVAYALALLLAGVFIDRFFCRYLCPLGAALAIPARLRMFEWLKRRHQCGRECRICATRCTVNAIHPDGHINPNECIYCLNCQTLYYDANTCPVLKARRRRRQGGEFAAAGKAGAPMGGSQ